MIALLSIATTIHLAASSDFCKVTGKFVEDFPNAISQNNREISGLALNPARTHFFSVSDSPEGDPLIFVTTNSASPRSAATIRISGITNTGFNGGYGDWESVVSYPCSSDPSQQCILVGDIGHNKVRNKGGTLRTGHQTVRFIEVEEPTAAELDSGQELQKPGKEFAFSYPGGSKFDAEAMVVKDNRLFVVTKNSAAYQFSHMFEVPKLDTSVELVERAVFKVSFSEVTGAASSPGYLILRTYIGLNFYKWDALCDASVRQSKIYQAVDYLERNRGVQEAVEYDAGSGYLYLAGEGTSTLYRMNCVQASSQRLSPSFGALCLDDFGGAATSVSSGCRHYYHAVAVLVMLFVTLCHS